MSHYSHPFRRLHFAAPLLLAPLLGYFLMRPDQAPPAEVAIQTAAMQAAAMSPAVQTGQQAAAPEPAVVSGDVSLGDSAVTPAATTADDQGAADDHAPEPDDAPVRSAFEEVAESQVQREAPPDFAVHSDLALVTYHGPTAALPMRDGQEPESDRPKPLDRTGNFALPPVASQFDESSHDSPATDQDEPFDYIPEGYVMVENPAHYRLVVGFVLGEETYRLQPGERRAFAGGPEWVIRFDRGGDFGQARQTLEQGGYQFRVSSQGWDVVRVQAEENQP